MHILAEVFVSSDELVGESGGKFFAKSERTLVQRTFSLALCSTEWRSADDVLSESPIGLPGC